MRMIHVSTGFLINHWEWFKNYDLDMKNKKLYYSIVSRDDKDPAASFFNAIVNEIEAEFDVKLKAELRL